METSNLAAAARRERPDPIDETTRRRRSLQSGAVIKAGLMARQQSRNNPATMMNHISNQLEITSDSLRLKPPLGPDSLIPGMRRVLLLPLLTGSFWRVCRIGSPLFESLSDGRMRSRQDTCPCIAVCHTGFCAGDFCARVVSFRCIRCDGLFECLIVSTIDSGHCAVRDDREEGWQEAVLVG